MHPTDIAHPDYFHKVVDCQWACPAHTPVPEYIRLIAQGRFGDAYMVNWNSNVFPGILGTHMRPPVRARVPPRPRGGKSRREARAGRDLPPEARRRRLQGGHHLAASEEARQAQRQTHRVRRRRPGLAHGGARSRAAGLSRDALRFGPSRRRHDPLADSQVPPSRERDRRGGGLHPRPRHRVQGRPSHRFAQGAARRRLRRRLHRLGRPAGPRPRHPGPQGCRGQHPHRHRLAFVGVLRAHRRRSASA